MVVDGKAIAQDLLKTVASQVAALPLPAPRLSIITCTPNLETQKYLALKQRKAAEVGIATNVIELIEGSSTEEVTQTVAAATEQSDGIIVQLPLPAEIDTNAVLAHIPTTHDVDGIHYDGEREPLPPVIGAIVEISRVHNIIFSGKRVTIIGAGRLVGAPSLLWASEQGGEVTLITKDTPPEESAAAIAAADIIISGAGSPGLITPGAIKAGVIIFDAGTSEAGGALVGDADAACAAKAALFTPVPGGIGPVTLAILLKNLTTLAAGSRSRVNML